MYLSSIGMVRQKVSETVMFPNLYHQMILAKNIYVEHRNHSIEIEILNGSGIFDLASITTDYLRTKHFDVVYYGNADKQSYDHTLIIQRNEKYHSLKLIGEAFDMDFTDKNHVILAPDESLCLDVTVIMGKDYKELDKLMNYISTSDYRYRKDLQNVKK